MFEFRGRFLALLSLLALLAAACGGGGQTAEEEAPASATSPGEDATPEGTEAAAAENIGSIRMVIGIAKTFEFLPAELGLELGVWEKRGLTVENLYVRGSGQVAQTLAAGEGDVAATAGASGLTPILGGLEARIVGEIGRDFNMMVVVTPDGSDVQTIEDLEGKTIGVTSQGSLTDWLAQQVASTQGWQVGQELQIAAVGGFDEQIAALQQGATDAFVWSAEAGFELEEQGEGRVLFDFGDIVGDNVFEVIVATLDAIENRPETIQAFLEGWYETILWMKDNKQETIDFMMEEFEFSEFVSTQTYEHDIDNLSTDGVIPEPNLQGLAQSVVDTGAVPEPPEISVFYDDRFVPVQVD